MEPKVETLNIAQLQQLILAAAMQIIANEPILTQLDSKIGDGDHGYGMKAGFLEVEKLLTETEFKSIFDLMKSCGLTLVKTMGGASGVLFGTLFTGGHSVLEGIEEISAKALVEFFAKSTGAVAKRGRCKAGDKTMLDALIGAVSEMQAELSRSDDCANILEAGERGANHGMEKTKAMLPRLGRSKNFRVHAIGVADPGAMSVYLIFKGMAKRIKEIKYATI